MKQSAAEWFYNELKELIKQSELTEMKPSEFDDRETKLLEQAKEMEKQQRNKDMMFAYEQGARLALLSQTDLALHKGVFPTPEEWIKDI